MFGFLLAASACGAAERRPATTETQAERRLLEFLYVGLLVEGQSDELALHFVRDQSVGLAENGEGLLVIDANTLLGPAARPRSVEPLDSVESDELVREVRACADRAVTTVSGRSIARARALSQSCRTLVPAPVERFARNDDLARALLDACLVEVRATLVARRGRTYEEARREAAAQARTCRMAVPDLSPSLDRHTGEVLALLESIDLEIASSGGVLVVEHPSDVPCSVRANGRPVGRSRAQPLRRHLSPGRYIVEARCDDASQIRAEVQLQLAEEAWVSVPTRATSEGLHTTGVLRAMGRTPYLSLVYPNEEALLRHSESDLRNILDVTGASFVRGLWPTSTPPPTGMHVHWFTSDFRRVGLFHLTVYRERGGRRR